MEGDKGPNLQYSMFLASPERLGSHEIAPGAGNCEIRPVSRSGPSLKYLVAASTPLQDGRRASFLEAELSGLSGGVLFSPFYYIDEIMPHNPLLSI